MWPNPKQNLKKDASHLKTAWHSKKQKKRLKKEKEKRKMRKSQTNLFFFTFTFLYIKIYILLEIMLLYYYVLQFFLAWQVIGIAVIKYQSP